MCYYSDDDMMSTFSRVSGTQDDVIGDEDDDDPTMSTSSFQNLPVDTSIASKPPDVSITSNGTDKPADEPPAATSDGKPVGNFVVSIILVKYMVVKLVYSYIQIFGENIFLSFSCLCNFLITL